MIPQKIFVYKYLINNLVQYPEKYFLLVHILCCCQYPFNTNFPSL